MPIKIPQLPPIPAGTITGKTSIPVAKTSTDPKTYKMTLDQTLSWLQTNGLSGGGGFSGYSGFSGATGLNGTNGTNGADGITRSIVLSYDPTNVFFYQSNNTTVKGASSTTLTALTRNLTATSGNPVVFTVTRYNSGGAVMGTSTFSGSGASYNTITYTTTQFGSANSALVSAVLTSGTDVYSDVLQIARNVDGADGQPTLTGILTNYSASVPSNNAGYVSDYSSINPAGSFLVYLGQTLISPGSISYSVVSQTNVTGSIASTGIYSITNFDTLASSGKLTLQATYGSQTLTAAFIVAKSYQGTAGTAKSLSIRLSKNVMPFTSSTLTGSGSGVPVITNDAITATAFLDNITPETSSTTINWTATLYDAAGAATATTLTSLNSAVVVFNASSFSNNPTAVVGVINASITDISTVVYGDTASITRLNNGSNGASGTDGTTGVVGVLSNDLGSIAAASDGSIDTGNLSALSGDFTVFYGTTDVTPTMSGANQFGVYSYINAPNTSAIFVQGQYPGVFNRYKIVSLGATLNAEIVLSATYLGVTTYKTFNVAKVVAGPAGDNGAGPVYRGTYDGTKQYFYIAGVRQDIVLQSGSYYRAINAAKNGTSTWGNPSSTPADWGPFGAQFESVATNLLLTQDAVIGRFLNLGGDTGGAPPETAIRSYSVTPTISATATGNKTVFTGNGFFLGYPTGATNAGANANFFVGNGTGAQSNYMWWDGDEFRIQGNVYINPLSGSGIYSGKTSFESTANGWWLGIANDGTPKFTIGDSSKSLKWDGTTLTTNGAAQNLAASGTIYLNKTGPNDDAQPGFWLGVSASNAYFTVGSNDSWLKYNDSTNTVQIKGVQSTDGLVVTSGLGMRYFSTSGSFTITGGTGNGAQYGAQIDLVGNDYTGANQGGQLVLQAGTGAESTIAMHTNNSGTFSGAVRGVQRLIIANNGRVTIMRSPYAGGGYNEQAGSLHIRGNASVGSAQPVLSDNSTENGETGYFYASTQMASPIISATSELNVIEGGNSYRIQTNGWGNRTLSVSAGAPSNSTGFPGDIHLVYS